MTVVLYLLLSPLLLVLAVVFKLLQPEKINKSYGYRTKRSMVNSETWQIGNTFASNLLLYIAIGLNFLQALVFLIWPSDHSFLIVAGCMVVAILSIIPLTEAHLRKYFE